VTTYHDRQLDALGDPTRRAVLAVLRGGSLPVGEIARQFAISRPAISQHLRILSDAQLVTHAADGTRRLYQINPAAFVSLRAYFDDFWTVALEAFARKAERSPNARKKSA
jgi:DNA-binding transcriptional ArsR family regulator